MNKNKRKFKHIFDDEIDNSVYQLILTLAEKSEDEIEWSMELIGEVTDAVKSVLTKFDIPVQHPAAVTNGDGSQEIAEYDDELSNTAASTCITEKNVFVAVACCEREIDILSIGESEEEAFKIVEADVMNVWGYNKEELDSLRQICDHASYYEELDLYFDSNGTGYCEKHGNNIDWEIIQKKIFVDENGKIITQLFTAEYIIEDADGDTFAVNSPKYASIAELKSKMEEIIVPAITSLTKSVSPYHIEMLITSNVSGYVDRDEFPSCHICDGEFIVDDE